MIRSFYYNREIPRLRSIIRQISIFGVLVLLAACARTVPVGPGIPVMQEQADYQEHAQSYYAPPGTPDDPWGPYIMEASERFDVPDTWIRAVIKQESGGHLYDSSGHFITSAPGAMGLMQLMPPAYDDLRNQYNLGPDPYNPRDNILAGTAYIRQMYEIYGSPGFLAAYNDGPGNVDHYLRQNRPLPKETRNYVKAIGPKIAGIWPKNRSKADLMVARYDRTAQRRSSVDTSSLNTTSLDDGASAAESLTDSSSSSVAAPSDNQSVSSVWASRGFSPASPPVRAKKPRPAPEPKHVVEVRSIPLAHPTRKRGRATDIIQSARTDWAIQIGSYASKKQASVVANKLRHFVVSSKGKTRTTIMAVHVKGRVLYRARYTGLTRAQAYSSCQRLTAITPCFAISP